MKKEMYAYIMITAVVSFLGFAVENIWLALTKGYFDNRNMFFPFLLGYGLAVMGIFAVFGTPMNPRFLGFSLNLNGTLLKMAVYFLFVMIAVSVGEIILGTVVEKTCGFCWWDYTRLPLHFTRYTSVPTSAAFSLIITAFMYSCFDPLYRFFMSWEDTALRVVALTLAVIMVGDCAYNLGCMYIRKATCRRWRVSVAASVGRSLLRVK